MEEKKINRLELKDDLKNNNVHLKINGQEINKIVEYKITRTVEEMELQLKTSIDICESSIDVGN